MSGPSLVLKGALFGAFALGWLLFAITAQASYPAAPQNLEGSSALQGAPGRLAIGADKSDRSSAACAVSDRFPGSVLQWCELITSYANQHGLPPDLVAALIWQESGGDPVAYSRSGAVGLMQVMPRDGLAAAFTCVNGPCFSNRPSTEQLKDPEFNIAYGTKMLAGLVKRYGDLREALHSYGPMDGGYSYADKVMGLFERYGRGVE
ncbi:MAG: transglycosylase SLT domain-containing protein [Chloroflexota bacterium]